ncbi:hypothetical protein D3C72_1593820 [compost metagenome]
MRFWAVASGRLPKMNGITILPCTSIRPVPEEPGVTICFLYAIHCAVVMSSGGTGGSHWPCAARRPGCAYTLSTCKSEAICSPPPGDR